MLGIMTIRLIEEGIVTLNVCSIILRLCFQAEYSVEYKLSLYFLTVDTM